MRLILRFALLAAGAGLLLGVLLRVLLGRRRLALLAPLALLPLLGHAVYLTWLTREAGLGAAAVLAFAAAAVLLLLLGALLARRWAAGRPSWSALAPAVTALLYALPASLLSVALSRAGVQPNAVWAAVYALTTIAFVALLLVFVPGGAPTGEKLRWPRRGP
jgi:hypothetical protein